MTASQRITNIQQDKTKRKRELAHRRNIQRVGRRGVEEVIYEIQKISGPAKEVHIYRLNTSNLIKQKCS